MAVGVINCLDRNEWIVKRGGGIGGSDASAVLGLNPYRTKLDIYRDKLHLKVENTIQTDEDFNKPFLEYGTKAEEPLRELFKLDFPELKVLHNANAIFYRKDKEYMRGSLDGYLIAQEDFDIVSYWRQNQLEETMPVENIKHIKKGMTGILEIKTTELFSSYHKEKWNNQVPQNYYIQILHYMNVMSADFAILKAQIKQVDKNGVETYQIRHYVFLASEVADDLVYEEDKITEFWTENIIPKIEPSLPINL
jgi:putative phage-type endonuclease